MVKIDTRPAEPRGGSPPAVLPGLAVAWAIALPTGEGPLRPKIYPQDRS